LRSIGFAFVGSLGGGGGGGRTDEVVAITRSAFPFNAVVGGRRLGILLTGELAKGADAKGGGTEKFGGGILVSMGKSRG
jgi:hypothetical protein